MKSMLHLSFLLIWWSDCTGKRSHHQSRGTISTKVVVDQLLLLTMVLLRTFFFFLFYLESQNITQIKQLLSFFRMRMGDGQIFMLPR